MRIELIIFSLLIAFICLTAEAPGYSGNSRFPKRSKRLLPYGGGSTDDSRGGDGGNGCNHDSQNGDNQQQDQEHQQAPRPRKQKNSNAKQRASGIAVQAAKEAKKANDDMASAVKVASDKIKNEYADKAMTAAKAAEAVLAGKGQMLEQLEAEVREAEVVVQEESQEFLTAEANAQLASKQFQQAQAELKMLLATLKVARESKESAEQMNSVWQQSLTEKTALLEAAQNRVAVLLRQLRDARSDHNKTKKAALKALCAAKEAKQRIEQVEAVRL